MPPHASSRPLLLQTKMPASISTMPLINSQTQSHRVCSLCRSTDPSLNVRSHLHATAVCESRNRKNFCIELRQSLRFIAYLIGVRATLPRFLEFPRGQAGRCRSGFSGSRRVRLLPTQEATRRDPSFLSPAVNGYTMRPTRLAIAILFLAGMAVLARLLTMESHAATPVNVPALIHP